jgi:hypothetical protein
MAQVLKPAPVVKLFIFLFFHSLWPSESAFSFFGFLASCFWFHTWLGVLKSTTIVASKVHSVWQSKFDFGRISKPALRGN